MIWDECKARLDQAMTARGLDALLVYGNAWQCDYLRYVPVLASSKARVWRSPSATAA